MSAWVQKQRGRPDELIAHYGLDIPHIVEAAQVLRRI